MKKVLLVAVLVISLTLAGCGNQAKTEKYEKTLEEYARNYFEKYVPVQGMSQVEIKIADLKNAVDHANADYDLSKLEGCTENSMVKLILKPNSRDIEKVEFELNCK